MKKITAILLLCVLLFDLGGYLIVHQYMEYRSDRFFEKQTAKGMYNRNDLVEIAIPMSMPGVHDWQNFEPISGQIQFQDNAYNYVQMKITRNVLFLKCVPNYQNTRLNTGNIIVAKGIKDMPVPKKEHVPYTAALFLNGHSILFQDPGSRVPVITLIQPPVPRLQQLIDRHIDIPKQPPRQSC